MKFSKIYKKLVKPKLKRNHVGCYKKFQNKAGSISNGNSGALQMSTVFRTSSAAKCRHCSSYLVLYLDQQLQEKRKYMDVMADYSEISGTSSETISMND